jgi:hypothetical protein
MLALAGEAESGDAPPPAPFNGETFAKTLPGVTGPIGFFDPLGFCSAEDITEGKIRFYREVELKHGRVGMLAALGFLVGENFHPLFGGNIDVPSYLAFQQTPLQQFWGAVLFAIAIPEIFSVFSFQSPVGGQPWTIRTDYEAGDLGFDPLGLKPTNAAELKEMQNKELNNGRLAMIAAAGMIAQELASGSKLLMATVEGTEVTAEAAPVEGKPVAVPASPSTTVFDGEAFAKTLPGVTGPLGFFDPIGFCSAEDITEGKIRFYREVELKHGRVGMLAALGFLVGENFHPLFGGDIDVPGYLAFKETPLEKFWGAVLFAIAIPEIFSVYSFQSPISGDLWSIRKGHEAGDLGFDPLGLKPTDAAELKEMQNKELNNGRLGMIAAAGMIAQELATGDKILMLSVSGQEVPYGARSDGETFARSLAGVTGPLAFWDPLGFCSAEGTTESKIKFYREVELKHGRVGMLAALGFLVGENFHPLFGGNIDVPSYLAFQQTPLQQFWGVVLFFIAIPEILSVFTFENPREETWAIRRDYASGDLGFDPLGLKPNDPAALREMQTKELNNGRLAMIAVAGMIAQELATGQKLF